LALVGQFGIMAGIVIPKRGGIARGICCFGAKSRFLTDKSVRNDNGQNIVFTILTHYRFGHKALL